MRFIIINKNKYEKQKSLLVFFHVYIIIVNEDKIIQKF